MIAYDEIKTQVLGQSRASVASYDDIKAGVAGGYRESGMDVNAWLESSYQNVLKANDLLQTNDYTAFQQSNLSLESDIQNGIAAQAWINRNRESLGKENADKALRQVEQNMKILGRLETALRDAKNYWSQWDSQEEYDAAVKASQQAQMTSSQIRQEIEEVTRQLNDEQKNDQKSERIKELEAERDRLDSLYQQKKQYEASIPEKLREEHILAQKKGVPIIYALKPAEKIDTFIGQDGTEFTIDISKMLQEAVAGVSQAGETGEPAPTAFKELSFVLRENGYDYYRANGTGQLYRFRYNEDDDKDEFQLMMGLRTTQGVDPLVFKKAEEEGSGPSSDDPFEEYVYYQNRRVKQADYAKAAHELYQSPFFRYSNAIGKAIDDVNQLVPNAVKGIQKVYENSPFAPTDKEKEEPPKDLLAALNAAKEEPEPTYGLQLYRNLPAAETFAGKAADFLGRLTVEAAETAYISLVTGGLGLGGKV